MVFGMHALGATLRRHRAAIAPVALLGLPLLLAGCAAGGDTFSAADPAGFWAGLWHGLILAFTFLISLFSDHVAVYEVANKGALYDLGFVLGVCIFFGGTGKTKKIRSKVRREKDREKAREWAEISERVEERVRTGIKHWLEESGQEDKEWKELGEKIEEKIKRELRKWADS